MKSTGRNRKAKNIAEINAPQNHIRGTFGYWFGDWLDIWYEHNQNNIQAVHSLTNDIKFWLMCTAWLYLVYDAGR